MAFLTQRGPILVGLFLLFGTRTARGCPWCGTESAREVRRTLLGTDFWQNALATALPILVLLLLVTLLYFWPSRGSPRHHVRIAHDDRRER